LRRLIPAGVADLLLSQVFGLGASLLVTFATAELLGPTGRGQLAFISAVATLGGVVVFGSLHVGITHAHKSGDDTALRRGLFLGALASLAALIIGVAFIIVELVLSGRSPRIYEMELGTVGAALVCFNLVVLRVRQGLGDARQFRVAWTIQSGVYALTAIPVAFFFRSATAVVFCWYAGLILATAYALRGYFRTITEPKRHVSTQEIATTSLAAHIGFTGIQFLYRADVLILAFFVTRSQLGIYSIAAPVAELAWVVSEALSLSAFSHYEANQSADERIKHRGRLIRINVAAGLLGAICIGPAAWLVIPYLLPRYVDAVPLIFILLPGVIVQGAARIAFSTLVSGGARKPAVSVGLISAALCLIYIPFCDRWGVTGAAIASTTIYVTQAIVVFAISRRQDRTVRLSPQI
jgi:O-antigen/teichoic acid export membrane protein